MKTSSILSTLAIVGSLFAAPACDGDAPPESAEPAAGQDPKMTPDVVATRVEAAVVRPSQASVRLVRPGEIEPSRDANVASPTGGLVEKVSVEVGDRVRSGQVLARVDSSLMSAQASLARVEVDDATRELERLRSMGKAVASARVDQAETRLERAKAQARISSIQSGRAVVKAPFGGVVSMVGPEKGEVLPPGGVIARIIQDDPVHVSVAVADRDVGTLDVGGRAAVKAAGSEDPVMGKIWRIEPAADLRTRAFQVEVEVVNADGRFRPGMIATVDFEVASSADRIIIPQDFLVTKLDENGVFIVDEGGVARWRTLRLGQVVQDQVVVESGLEDGDKVVVVGHRALVDGDPLLIAREGECCTRGRVRFPGDAPLAVATPKAEAPRGEKADEGAEEGTVADGAEPEGGEDK